MNTKWSSVDEYLSALPDDPRTALEKLRRMIKAMVPEAVESISYGIPTFKYKGKPLIYLGAAKTHCALYGTSKGTMRFQPGDPPPETLVRALVSERIVAIPNLQGWTQRQAIERGNSGLNPPTPS